MQSSNHVYLSNLDHLRGFAAFIVFTWHFVHHSIACSQTCYGTAYSTLVNLPFFTFLEQGHTGVALFLCISGYIFTRLSFGNRVHLVGFWLNRLLRLFPLLLFVGACTVALKLFMRNNFSSWPTERDFFHLLFYPGGSWTVYIELRYYLILPLLLLAMRKIKPLSLLPCLLLITFSYRLIQWHSQGTVEYIAYYKIIGRMDQFLAGSMAFCLERWIVARYASNKHILRYAALAGVFGLLVTYQYFSLSGGYYYMNGQSTSIIWVFMPLIEGLCYSAIIIGYLTLTLPARADRIFSAIGRWSYSIYFNHFLILPFIFLWISTYWFMPTGFYGRVLMGTLVAFPMVIGVSALTYRIIEKPFLRLRKPYLTPISP